MAKASTKKTATKQAADSTPAGKKLKAAAGVNADPPASGNSPSAGAAPGPSEPTAALSRFQKFESVTIHRRLLKNAPYNPRQITPSARRRLKEGIKRFGLVGGIVWNVRTGNLVGGHRRVGEIDDLEGTDDYLLTVDKIDVDDDTERAINVLLNNPAAQGQFDLSLLQDVIGQLAESTVDPRDTGYSTADMHAMFGDDFLTGVFKEQAESDAPQLNILEEMRQAGKEAGKEADGSGGSGKKDPAPGPGSADSPTAQPHAADSTDRTCQPPSLATNNPDLKPPDRGQMQSSDNPPAAGASPQAASDSTHAPAQPNANHFEGYDFTSYKPDPAREPEAYAVYKRFLHARRAKYRDAKTSNEDAADTYITIVFDTPEEIYPLLDRLGLDGELRMFDAREVVAALDEIEQGG